jgi:3-oxoacyl-[acyl-carrier-protein] synthase II
MASSPAKAPPSSSSKKAAHARARGLPGLARLAAAALGAESHNRVAARADGGGSAEGMERALSLAGLSPEEVGHVNAHGTGTRVNDSAEAAALRRVFGPRLAGMAITSTKPVTGHTFGAAAALEAVLTIESLRRQLAPPTAGFRAPDPALELVPVQGAARPFVSRYAMSNSLGFWGNTACLIFGRTD